MSFLRNAAGLLLTSAVTLPVGLLTGIVLARWLTVEERGIYSVATTFAALAAIMGKLGVPSATIYRLRRIRIPRERVAGMGLLLLATSATSAVLLGFAFEPWLVERFFSGAPREAFVIALSLIPVLLLTNHFASLARGIDRFRLQNIANVANAILTLAALGVVLILREGGVVEALLALVVIHLLVLLWLAAAVLRHTGLDPRPRAGDARDTVRFGIKTYAQTLAGQLHERVDVFMLAYFLGDPAQIAIYTVAVGVIGRLKLVPEAIAAAAFPQLAGLSREQAGEFACRVARQSTFWAIATAAALLVIAPLLLPLLYGEPYRASVLPFLVLLPGMVLLTLYRVLSRYFTAIDRQQANIASQTISTVANILLNLVLIPRYGILGAAVSSLVSYSLEAVLIAAIFRRVAGRGLRETFVLTRSDVVELRQRATVAWERLRQRGRGRS